MNDEQLTALAADVAAGYGTVCTKATFEPFTEMKLRWVRSLDWITFEVSDYLASAPEDVLRDLIGNAMARIRGQVAGDNGMTLEWSMAHADDTYRIWMARHDAEAISSPVVRDLAAAARADGLIPDGYDVFQRDGRRGCQASMVYRTVLISPTASYDDVMDELESLDRAIRKL